VNWDTAIDGRQTFEEQMARASIRQCRAKVVDVQARRQQTDGESDHTL